jgi:hypothetical protein
VAILLVRWYLDPPPPMRSRAASSLMAGGAAQLLTRLVLPGARTATLDISTCWHWLLSACSRPHHREILAFVSAVPSFVTAVRESSELRRRPAQCAVWLLLLACMAASEPTRQASLAEEASEQVRLALAQPATGVSGEGCEALNHSVELVALLGSASAVLRELLLSVHGAAIIQQLDALKARALAAPRASQNAAEPPPSRVGAGAEKESELLQRAAAGLKTLTNALRAPGKGD